MDTNSEFKFGSLESFSLIYINLYLDSIYAIILIFLFFMKI